jgi:hypothetical protein
MHIYNWYHSDVTGIHYVHEYVTVCYRAIPLLFAFSFLHSVLLPICLPLLTWNPPCCDRIRPPRSQVARKLIFPFPSPCSYTPHSKIPTPRSSPDPNIHSLGRHRELGSQDPAQKHIGDKTYRLQNVSATRRIAGQNVSLDKTYQRQTESAGLKKSI